MKYISSPQEFMERLAQEWQALWGVRSYCREERGISLYAEGTDLNQWLAAQRFWSFSSVQLDSQRLAHLDPKSSLVLWPSYDLRLQAPQAQLLFTVSSIKVRSSEIGSIPPKRISRLPELSQALPYRVERVFTELEPALDYYRQRAAQKLHRSHPPELTALERFIAPLKERGYAIRYGYQSGFFSLIWNFSTPPFIHSTPFPYSPKEAQLDTDYELIFPTGGMLYGWNER